MPTDSNDIRGWVYVIVNDLIPDRIKVGFTRKDPVERARELVSTGTTGNFVVIYHAWVANAREVEQQVHRRLHSFSAGLEWFSVSADRAVEEIRTVAGLGLYTEDTTPRWHPTQAEPALWAKQALEEAKRRAEAKRREAEEKSLREAALAEEERLKIEREAEEERVRLEEEDRLRAEELAESRRQEEQRRNRVMQERAIRRSCFWRIARTAVATIASLTVIGGLLFVIIAPPMPSTVRHLRDAAKKAAASLGQCQAALQDERNVLQQSKERLRKHSEDLEHLEAGLLALEGDLKVRENTLRDVQRQMAEVQSQQLARVREMDLLKGLLSRAQECRGHISDVKRDIAKRAAERNTLSRDIAMTKETIRRSTEAVPSAVKQVEEKRQRVMQLNSDLNDAEAWWARLGASWIIE